jgi:hypothetical protein
MVHQVSCKHSYFPAGYVRDSDSKLFSQIKKKMVFATHPSTFRCFLSTWRPKNNLVRLTKLVNNSWSRNIFTNRLVGGVVVDWHKPDPFPSIRDHMLLSCDGSLANQMSWFVLLRDSLAGTGPGKISSDRLLTDEGGDSDERSLMCLLGTKRTK